MIDITAFKFAKVAFDSLALCGIHETGLTIGRGSCVPNRLGSRLLESVWWACNWLRENFLNFAIRLLGWKPGGPDVDVRELWPIPARSGLSHLTS